MIANIVLALALAQAPLQPDPGPAADTTPKAANATTLDVVEARHQRGPGGVVVVARAAHPRQRRGLDRSRRVARVVGRLGHPRPHQLAQPHHLPFHHIHADAAHGLRRRAIARVARPFHLQLQGGER